MSSQDKLVLDIAFEDLDPVVRENRGKTSQSPIEGFELDLLAPLEAQLEYLCQRFGAKRKAADYVLQLGWNREYLYVDEPLKGQIGPDVTIPKGKKTATLKVRPDILVQSICKELTTAAIASPALKDIVFRLRYLLVDGVFAEEFILEDGVHNLRRIIAEAEGNTKAYALYALRLTMVYVSAMEQLVEEPEIIEQLYQLIALKNEEDPNFQIRRNVLELLFVFCNYNNEIGFDLINRAAFSLASDRGQQPYEELLSLLRRGDVNIQLNALTLINSLLQTAPSAAGIANDLIKCWRNQDIDTSLHALSNSQHPPIKSQLAIYQQFTGTTFRQDEVNLAVRILKLEEALLQFQLQQPLIRILRSEYVKARKTIQEQIDAGSLLNPYVPIERYDSSQAVTSEDSTQPADLSDDLVQRPSSAAVAAPAAAATTVNDKDKRKSIAMRTLSGIGSLRSKKPNEKNDKRTSTLLSEFFNAPQDGGSTKDTTSVNAPASGGTIRSRTKPLALLMEQQQQQQQQPAQSAASKRSSVYFGRSVSEDRLGVFSVDEEARLSKLLEEEKHQVEILTRRLEDTSVNHARIAEALMQRIRLLEKALDIEVSQELEKRKYSDVAKGCLREGALLKRRKRKDWKARYFVQSGEFLYYFEISSMKEKPKADALPLGVISLRMVTQVDLIADYEFLQPGCFVIQKMDSATYLSASSDDARDSWIKSLKEITASIQASDATSSSSISKADNLSALMSLVSSRSAEPSNDSPASIAPSPQSIISSQGPSPPPPPPPPSSSGTPPPPPPPAPGIGGMPPPPPPPGGFMPMVPSGPQPTKPAVIPNQKMKPLYWNRILNSGSKVKTIWDDIVEPSFDISEFEDLFSNKSKGSKDDDEDDNKPAATSKRRLLLSVLEQKRSQKIAIIKSALPKGQDLITAIRNMETLSLDQLNQLIIACPTLEEIKLIEEASSQPSSPPLDAPEEFLMLLNTVPFLSARLKCWAFFLSYTSSLEDFQPPLKQLHQAIQQTLSSRSLRIVLGYVLSYGNYMNGGNARRGQADGFEIEILEKLDGTKDNQGKQSLLEFVARTATDAQPSVATLATDLEAIAGAVRMPFDEVKSNFTKLKAQTKAVAETFQEHKDKFSSTDIFVKRIDPFLTKAAKEIQSLEKEVNEIEKQYKELVIFFGFSPEKAKSISPSEFFGMLWSFLVKFQAILQKLDRERKRAEPKKIRVKARRIDGRTDEEAKEEDLMASVVASITEGKGMRMRSASKAGDIARTHETRSLIVRN